MKEKLLEKEEKHRKKEERKKERQERKAAAEGGEGFKITYLNVDEKKEGEEEESESEEDSLVGGFSPQDNPFDNNNSGALVTNLTLNNGNNQKEGEQVDNPNYNPFLDGDNDADNGSKLAEKSSEKKARRLSLLFGQLSSKSEKKPLESGEQEKTVVVEVAGDDDVI